MKELRAWLGRTTRPGNRRATFGDNADGYFEIGLFSRDSGFVDGSPLRDHAGRPVQGHGWRYWRKPTYEATLAAVEAWAAVNP